MTPFSWAKQPPPNWSCFFLFGSPDLTRLDQQKHLHQIFVFFLPETSRCNVPYALTVPAQQVVAKSPFARRGTPWKKWKFPPQILPKQFREGNNLPRNMLVGSVFATFKNSCSMFRFAGDSIRKWVRSEQTMLIQRKLCTLSRIPNWTNHFFPTFWV